MDKLLLIAGVIIALVVILMLLDRARYTRVSSAERTWVVAAGYDNSTAAAALLDRVHSRVIAFMRVLKVKYHIDETEDEAGAHNHSAIDVDRRKIVDALLNGYNPDVLTEHIPLGNETSYTRNKGEAMRLCLRSKERPGELVSEDTLMFVVLHEISHIAAYDTWGHTPRFWQVFKFILQEAVAAGMYIPVDYAAAPVNYCGLNLSHNPLYDPTI
jgi:hypothetical protein